MLYCLCEKYTVLVESIRLDDGGKTILARVSPSTKALRWNLQCQGVIYSLPLDRKKAVPYYDSLEPDQVGQINRETYEQGHITQLLVEGEDQVSRLLSVIEEKFESEYLDLTYFVPRLLSAFPFDHSIKERMSLQSSGSLVRTEGTTTKTIHRIELGGMLLPHNVHQIFSCLQEHVQNSQERPYCEIIMSTEEYTKGFNLPSNSKSLSISESPFLQRIEFFSEGAVFHLDHE
jgi:hypothetical protein